MADAALLVPAYNAAAYLPRFAAATNAQTRPFDERLCFDDASTDGTLGAIQAAGFKLLASPTNRGPSFARNRLAEAATSEWLHFHDADDLFTSNYLACALAAAGPDCDVVLCDSSWELESTRERIIHWTYRQSDCDPDPLAYVLTHPVGMISALIRRKNFLAIGGFDETKKCWEDADLFVRLAEHGARFRMLEQTLVTSIRHNRGLSHDQLHCDHCRLDFLRGYVARHPARLRPAHAAEVEKLLPRFLGHGDGAAAREALAFCRTLGGNPPTTSSRGLRALKPFLPALWLVRLQHRLRNAAHS